MGRRLDVVAGVGNGKDVRSSDLMFVVLQRRNPDLLFLLLMGLLLQDDGLDDLVGRLWLMGGQLDVSLVLGKLGLWWSDKVKCFNVGFHIDHSRMGRRGGCGQGGVIHNGRDLSNSWPRRSHDCWRIQK